MKVMVLTGVDNEIGRTPCGHCTRLPKVGQSVAVARIKGGEYGRRTFLIHKACMLAVAAEMDDGTIIGTRQQVALDAERRSLQAEAEALRSERAA